MYEMSLLLLLPSFLPLLSPSPLPSLLIPLPPPPPSTQEYMPDLNDHFTKHRVEVHMFATQWFFTLFTAKFPLPLVFQFMDIYLCDRMPAMFQAALALLKVSGGGGLGEVG